MKPIIEIKNLSKIYKIGLKQPYYSLRDSIVDSIKKPLKIFRPKEKINGDIVNDEFWALKDVSFQVKEGEVIGVIGKNGAGKTTLLKILSQITPPTYGEIILRGRVASLLEVGTGFHPELTGRENIFLNGAILGMKQKEIRKKFDEIVDFAEIDKFLDTPVKHFSTGMYMRLAFAVAAHLDSEILLVDEVLAVGDLAFQNKCLGKMDEIGKGGRTILLVSHNLSSVRNLCERCLYIHDGKIVKFGKTEKIINKYLNNIWHKSGRTNLTNILNRSGTGKVKFTEFTLQKKASNTQILFSGDSATMLLGFKGSCKNRLKMLNFGISVDDQFGNRIFVLSTELTGETFESLPSEGYIKVNIPRLPLVPGRYAVTLFMTENGEISDWIQQAAFFNVESGNFYQTGKLPVNQGSFLIDHNFFFSQKYEHFKD